jgi:hypothetical protein
LQHLAEDMSIIPCAADWLQYLEPPAAGAAFTLPQTLPSAEQLAAASARHFDASPNLLLPLHSWFLETAAWFDDPRHCAMRHHSFGIFEAEQRFGIVLYQYRHSVPTRIVAEWHVRAVLGRIPAAADFLRRIKGQPWMAAAHNARRRGLCGARLDDHPAPEQPVRQANRASGTLSPDQPPHPASAKEREDHRKGMNPAGKRAPACSSRTLLSEAHHARDHHQRHKPHDH